MKAIGKHIFSFTLLLLAIQLLLANQVVNAEADLIIHGGQITQSVEHEVQIDQQFHHYIHNPSKNSNHNREFEAIEIEEEEEDDKLESAQYVECGIDFISLFHAIQSDEITAVNTFYTSLDKDFSRFSGNRAVSILFETFRL